jgi:lipoate-protein ligase A
MMSKVLRVPDEKFRDKVYKTMNENLTTMRRESGRVPEIADLAAALTQRLEPLLGPFTARELDPELAAHADRLVLDMLQPDWLYAADRRRTEREVKIAEGVFVISKMIKTPGGLLRVTAVNRQDRLSDVQLSGDFFFYPAQRLSDLERALEGVPVESEAILSTVQAFYNQYQVESPGMRPENFAEVLAAT